MPTPSAPNAPAPAKICTVCGKDCSAIDRIKDVQGRYTCKPCHDKAGGGVGGAKAAEPSIESIYERPQGRPCPQCDKPMPPDAEICVACGYNLRAGKAVKTKLGKLDPSQAASLEASSKRRSKPKVWSIAACVGGLLAASAWFALVYFGGDATAYLSAAVGLCVGLSLAAIAREHCGPRAAGIAAGLALLWMVIAKSGAAAAIVLAHGPTRPQPVTVNDSLAQMLIANDVAKKMTDEGKQLYWPAGYTPQTAKQPDHFPPEVWQEAMRQWEKNGPGWQNDYKRAQSETLQFTADETFAKDRQALFLKQFDWFDTLWGGIGLLAATLAGAGVHKMIGKKAAN